jgi:6-phosphogluconolactonase (cycloisomerase 2 family)
VPTLTIPPQPPSGGPLGPMPDFGMPDDMRHGAGRGRRGVTAIAALATALVLALGVIVVLALGGGDKPAGDSTAPGRAQFDGTVYVESNLSAPGANSVLGFRYRGGSLRPLDVTEYPTGGAGSQDLSNSGVLDIDGSVAVSTERKLLFAVNASSDTIAVFRIGRDGELTPVEGSPFPSQGKGPASVDYRDGHLFVANKAHDGIRTLFREPPNYASFAVSKEGALTPVGKPQPTAPAGSPTQAFVTPDGKLLLATDLQGPEPYSAGPLHSFKIGADGSLTPAAGSPFPLDPQVLEGKQPRQAVWAQGLVALERERLVYAGVANLKLLVVYSYDPESGRLTFVRSVPNKGSVLPCWTEMSPDGRFLYTGNAGNNTVSVFDIAADPRNPRQIQTFKLKGGGNPWNFTLDPTGRFIFLVDMRAADFVPAGQGNELHTLAIGRDGRLSEPDYSPVPIPVPTGTNPWGIAVVPRG